MTRETSPDESAADVSEDDAAKLLIGTEEKSDTAAEQAVDRLSGSTEFTHRNDEGETFTT